MAVGEMRGPADELLTTLDEAVSVLDMVGETWWRADLAQSRAEIANGDFYGVARLLGAFGGMGSFRAGQVGTTAENLAAAIAGENYENVTMYPDFASEADADGQAPVAKLFRMIAEVEGVHEALFTQALAALEDDSEELTFFVCPFCGYVELGRPEKCPVCGVPGERFIEAA